MHWLESPGLDPATSHSILCKKKKKKNHGVTDCWRIITEGPHTRFIIFRSTNLCQELGAGELLHLGRILAFQILFVVQSSSPTHPLKDHCDMSPACVRTHVLPTGAKVPGRGLCTEWVSRKGCL